MPFYWVITNKTLLPKELEFPGLNTIKETFIIYDEK